MQCRGIFKYLSSPPSLLLAVTRKQGIRKTYLVRPRKKARHGWRLLHQSDFFAIKRGRKRILSPPAEVQEKPTPAKPRIIIAQVRSARSGVTGLHPYETPVPKLSAKRRDVGRDVQPVPPSVKVPEGLMSG